LLPRRRRRVGAETRLGTWKAIGIDVVAVCDILLLLLLLLLLPRLYAGRVLGPGGDEVCNKNKKGEINSVGTGRGN